MLRSARRRWRRSRRGASWAPIVSSNDGSGRKAVHIGPLPDDLFAIGRLHDRIGGAVPNRNLRPRPAMFRSRSHAIAERMGGMRLLREHGVEGLLDGARGAVGKSGDDGAAGKHLRICRQHCRSHGAAGRQAGHEHPAPVDTECRDGVLDHLPDRACLAEVARGVARQEPRKAILRIVGRLLLGIDDREAEAIGQHRPAAAAVVFSGGLAAAMQRDHQRRPLGRPSGT